MKVASILLSLLPLVALPACSGGAAKKDGKIEYAGCAHAHNDYQHDVPLLDALSAGFCSVEADIWLVSGSSLLVAHDLPDVDPARSLQSLYLDPLVAIAASNGGSVIPGRTEPFTLLVDVKSDAAATWPVLEDVLAEYDALLTRFDGGVETAGAVTAIVSGGRDRAAMEAAATRHAAMDGRLDDLGTGAPLSLIPLVSADWSMAFDWSGHDDIPDEQRDLLEGHAADAHAEGRRIRFWGSPNLERVWREEAKAGVDLLNADTLDAMQAFLAEETQAPDS